MPSLESAELSDLLRQLCTSLYTSQELAVQRRGEVSAGPARLRGLHQEHEHALHRLTVVKARLAIEGDLLTQQNQMLSQTLQQLELLDGCHAGILLGLDTLQQVEVVAATCEASDGSLMHLTSAQAQLQAMQEAVASAADMAHRLGAAPAQGQGSGRPSGSPALRVVDVARQRLLDVAEELQVAQALLASSVSDLDHQIAGVINTCEGVFECLICRSDISMQNCFLITSCGHRLCRPCAFQSIQADMDMQVVSACPVCKAEPCPRCLVSLSKDRGFTTGGQAEEQGSSAALHCMITQQDAMTLLSDEDYYRFLSIPILQAQHAGLFMRCPGQECGQGVQMEAGEVHFRCPTCSFEFCTACGVKWHEGSTCQQYQAWLKANATGDEEFDRLHRAMGSRKCPKCQHAVIKEDASQCNKISCRMCRIVFCWICGQQIQGYSHFNDRASACYNKLFAGLPGH